MQYLFNKTIKEHVKMVKKELAKVMPTLTEEQQLWVKKAVSEFDKGMKAITTRQRHIRIADHLELGWSVVAAYESDELADNSDDKKRLFKAEKEAERRQQKRKRKQNPTVDAKKCVPEANGPELPAGRGGGMGSRPPPIRARKIGPCYYCGDFGHLVASYTKPRPFDQPLVSEAADSVACLLNVSHKKGGFDKVKSSRELCKLTISGGAPSPVQSVDNDQIEYHKPAQVARTEYRITEDTLETLEGHELFDLGKCWELESSESHSQVTDIQGRLRWAYMFWNDTLQAQGAVLDWIQTGYNLPMLCAPTLLPGQPPVDLVSCIVQER